MTCLLETDEDPLMEWIGLALTRRGTSVAHAGPAPLSIERPLDLDAGQTTPVVHPLRHEAARRTTHRSR
jgi:hypothetical protein